MFFLQETSKDIKSNGARLKPLKRRDLTPKDTKTKPSGPPPGRFTDVSSSVLPSCFIKEAQKSNRMQFVMFVIEN